MAAIKLALMIGQAVSAAVSGDKDPIPVIAFLGVTGHYRISKHSENIFWVHNCF
jgi:hypothetical protein